MLGDEFRIMTCKTDVRLNFLSSCLLFTRYNHVVLLNTFSAWKSVVESFSGAVLAKRKLLVAFILQDPEYIILIVLFDKMALSSTFGPNLDSPSDYWSRREGHHLETGTILAPCPLTQSGRFITFSPIMNKSNDKNKNNRSCISLHWHKSVDNLTTHAVALQITVLRENLLQTDPRQFSRSLRLLQ